MKCCICGCEFDGYGCNPYPVVEDMDARCCEECDGAFVVPARIEAWLNRKNVSKNKKED